MGKGMRVPRSVWAVAGTLFVLALFALADAAPRLPLGQWQALALLMVTAAAAERFQIPLFRTSSVSVAFAATYAALVHLGPEAAVWINLCIGLMLCVTPRRKHPVQMLFNVGNQVLAAWLAGQILLGTVGSPVSGNVGLGLVLPVLLAELVYFLFNTSMLATVISRTTNASWMAVWRTNYGWLFPQCLALAMAGVAMGALIGAVGPLGVLIFAVPLAMARHSFNLYMTKTREERERNEELQLSNAQLDATNAHLNQRVTELAVLNKVGLSLNGSLDLSNVLGEILASSLTLLPTAQGAGVALADPASGRLRVANSIGLAATAVEALEAYDGPAVRVFESGEVLTIAEAVDGALLNAGVRALTALPLRWNGGIGGVFLLTFGGVHEQSAHEAMLLATMGEQASAAIHNALLYRQIEESHLATVRAMVGVVEGRERYAQGHAERIRSYCAATANELGLDERRKTTLELAALFHDIGHIGVPESVLSKPGELTAAEWEVVRKHPLLGVAILKQVPRMEAVIPVILHHHERYDGLGYPEGLLGNDTDLLAQILAVADAFEAMTSTRPHRPAMTREQAIAEIEWVAGTQFAPRVVEAFVRAHVEDRAATTVRATAPSWRALT
jgi:HD-GYP domain-containing protein (c-di-GMP phosphodiesterase class II)